MSSIIALILALALFIGVPFILLRSLIKLWHKEKRK